MARFAPSSGPAQPAEAPGRTDLAPLWSLLALVKPYRWRFWLATIALFVSSGLGLVYPQAARQAVDIGLAAPTLDRLNLLVLGLILVFLVQAVFIWVRHFLMSWLGERVVADLRVQVFDKLLTLPPSWFHVRHTGEILSRLSSDVTVVDHLVGSELSLALRHSLTLVGGIVLLFIENPKLTLLMLAIVPPVVVGVVFFGRRVRRLDRATAGASAAGRGWPRPGLLAAVASRLAGAGPDTFAPAATGVDHRDGHRLSTTGGHARIAGSLVGTPGRRVAGTLAGSDGGRPAISGVFVMTHYYMLRYLSEWHTFLE